MLKGINMERSRIFGIAAILITLLYCCSLLLLLLEDTTFVIHGSWSRVLRQYAFDNLTKISKELELGSNVENITFPSSQNVKSVTDYVGEYNISSDSQSERKLGLKLIREHSISRDSQNVEKKIVDNNGEYEFSIGATQNLENTTFDVIDIDNITLPGIIVENLTLADIFITVRTSSIFQFSRFPLVLKTWFQLAKDHIWFLTDTASRLQQRQTNGRMINTNCSTSHNVPDLCCKTNVGFDRFVESGKKWWCRFDDDNYVNIPRLVDMLQRFDHTNDWYLGKAIRPPGSRIPAGYLNIKIFYATGGAGYCISKALGLRMLPFFGSGKFVTNCVKLWFPEDISMGYCLEHMLNATMTYVPQLHSHLEGLSVLKLDTFKDQVSFSFSKAFTTWNVLKVPGFHGRYDPTRMLSLHCFLYPDFKFCLR